MSTKVFIRELHMGPGPHPNDSSQDTHGVLHLPAGDPTHLSRVRWPWIASWVGSTVSAIYKPTVLKREDLFQRGARGELMAAALNDFLGLGVVPPTKAVILKHRGPWTIPADWVEKYTPEDIDFLHGSAQLWIPNARMWGEILWSRIRERVTGRASKDVIWKLKQPILESEGLRRIMLLDELLGHNDRHDGNVLIDATGKPWAIDNEFVSQIPTATDMWPMLYDHDDPSDLIIRIPQWLKDYNLPRHSQGQIPGFDKEYSQYIYDRLRELKEKGFIWN